MLKSHYLPAPCARGGAVDAMATGRRAQCHREVVVGEGDVVVASAGLGAESPHVLRALAGRQVNRVVAEAGPVVHVVPIARRAEPHGRAEITAAEFPTCEHVHENVS